VTLILAASLLCVLIIGVLVVALAWQMTTWCVRLDAEMRDLRIRLGQLDAPDREVPLPTEVAR
jgi:hypothetical protein